MIEREDVGWGASSRNGGQVLTGMKLDAASLVGRFGETHARQLFDVATDSIVRLEALIAAESIDCKYERTGHLCAAFKPSHFDAFRDEQALLQRVLDHLVRLIAKAEQRGEIGSDAYHGVLVDDRSGALNPARYVRRLGAAARRAGATLVTGTAVMSIERQGAGWRLRTSTGEVDAADVLLATNGYTARGLAGTAAAIRADWQLHHRDRAARSGGGVSAPSAQADGVRLETLPVLLPRHDGSAPAVRWPGGVRAARSGHHAAGGRDSARRHGDGVFRSSPACGIDYAWGGNVAFTRDQMPRAGRLDGLYYAGGYCGHGIAMATYLGEQIARRIAGEPIDHPLFDDRFPPIPMYLGKPWFLPLVGAYYQVKDWLQ